MNRQITTTDKLRAQSLNRTGLEHYERWELDTAITLFQEAVRLDNGEPEYYLNLARTEVRLGDYELMLQALGEYVRTETDRGMVSRFESLFSNSLDDIESLVTTVMPAEGISLEVVGSAIQMWVEYRVTVGKDFLDLSHPEEWAASLDYTVRKVNFKEAPIAKIAQLYKTTESAIRHGHGEMVKTLDIMPCDYRYFRGEDNPLDKLVEAAIMLEELEHRFRSDE